MAKPVLIDTLTLQGPCRAQAKVFDFDAGNYVAHRHVYKHVLRESEAWDGHVTCDLTAARRRLKELECRGAGTGDNPEIGHGNGCPKFTLCHDELEKLLSQYREVIKATLREGAERPRHSHARFSKTTRKGEPYVEWESYFLASRGFLAQTYRRMNGELHLKTAYRRDLGRALETDGRYMQEASTYVLRVLCNRDRTLEHSLCLPATWGGLGGLHERWPRT